VSPPSSRASSLPGTIPLRGRLRHLNPAVAEVLWVLLRLLSCVGRSRVRVLERQRGGTRPAKNGRVAFKLLAATSLIPGVSLFPPSGASRLPGTIPSRGPFRYQNPACARVFRGCQMPSFLARFVPGKGATWWGVVSVGMNCQAALRLVGWGFEGGIRYSSNMLANVL